MVDICNLYLNLKQFVDKNGLGEAQRLGNIDRLLETCGDNSAEQTRGQHPVHYVLFELRLRTVFFIHVNRVPVIYQIRVLSHVLFPESMLLPYTLAYLYMNLLTRLISYSHYSTLLYPNSPIYLHIFLLS